MNFSLKKTRGIPVMKLLAGHWLDCADYVDYNHKNQTKVTHSLLET